MKIKCTECKYLTMHHRSGGIYSSYGRGEYYCEHPVSRRLPAKAFGNKARSGSGRSYWNGQYRGSDRCGIVCIWIFAPESR